MASGVDLGSSSESQDPYERLGISADAGFEEVQRARETSLKAAGDDPMARARIETAYDAVLMGRLRERQSGTISSAAVTASRLEDQSASTPASSPVNPSALLTRIRNLSLPSPKLNSAGFLPSLSLVEGQGLLVRVIAGGIGLLLLLAAPTAVDLVLALSTIGLFISQVKRGRKPLGALGWSLALVALGLVLGAVIAALFATQSGLPLNPILLEALPAYLVLLAGTLLLL
ncbi:MAG: CPP1-like family protein [Synechococcus sp.]|jgi:hypothetical protein|uniref:CPP1-like family protein n=1 Tax=Synechococcus sp. PROS-9-1 TaxID=1968775 RepID=UPI000B748178|nr:CPP1-like family protein [Synechococcus sp. PROS-9-1]QNJ31600.1 hypothetical protein SynPROS91_01224 [Synechococcus sp. PROS-9-1]RCL61079.1 MAG: molecular chaperone DnaJ [Synechococcus sp. MED-G68]|tara:strand:+ start:9795 stop:10484 length:690 start_codon:yes stop_codon:yes gene_type:complete